MRISRGQLRRIIREVADEEANPDAPPVGHGLDKVVKHHRQDVENTFLDELQNSRAIDRLVTQLISVARTTGRRTPKLGDTLDDEAVGRESDFEMTAAMGVFQELARALTEAYFESEAQRRK